MLEIARRQPSGRTCHRCLFLTNGFSYLTTGAAPMTQKTAQGSQFQFRAASPNYVQIRQAVPRCQAKGLKFVRSSKASTPSTRLSQSTTK
jgi:hypothetical protein